jgi:hypothetical protein
MRSVRFATMLAFSVAANTPLVAQPIVLGALVEQLHLSQRDAGLVVASELVGLTIGLFTLVLRLRSISSVQLALLSVGLILVANFATTQVSTVSALLLVRSLAGVGASAAFAVYLSMASAERVPEHVFAIVGAATLAYSGAILWIAPQVLGAWGLPGLLGLMSGITVLACATLPDVKAHREETRRGALLALPAFAGHLMPVLAMIVLLYAGHGAIWAYQERIGQSVGLPSDTIARVLAASMFGAGMVGSLLARAIGLSLGRVWPQVISLLTAIGATAWLVMGTSALSFTVASAAVAFSWTFGLPFQFGLLAGGDSSGRAVLAGVMVSTGGMALGPAVAAQLVGNATYVSVAVFAMLCYLIGLAIAVPAARRASATSATG